MELYNILAGFGVVIILMLGFNTFYSWGNNAYGVTGTDLYGQDINDTFINLTNEDTTTLSESTFNEDDIFGNIWKAGGLMLKQVGSSVRWLGMITGLTGQMSQTLPIDNAIYSVFIGIIVLILIGLIVATLLGR